MSNRSVFLLISAAASLVIIIAAVAIGSVAVSPIETISILVSRFTGIQMDPEIPGYRIAIVADLRLPRVLLAFIAGAALSVSGAVMQSVLKNPLASSFTLGVSSGASLGAGSVILFGLSGALHGMLTVPAAGFAASVLTVFLLLRFSRAIDPSLRNNTIILSGMILSLFLNAILTLFSVLSTDGLKNILSWQLGSFALRGMTPVYLLLPLTAAGTLAIFRYRRELDILTFGGDEAAALGVPVRKTKNTLVILASVLTGCTIAFTGVIGFVDLAIPHIVRRLWGPSHRTLIPFSFLFGGSFMVLADLFCRTVYPPAELPVGVVTALMGAPVFAHIYLSSRRSGA